MKNANQSAGFGQHSHEVPSSPGVVVDIRDGHHLGTSIWQREDGTFCFASHDADTLERAQRCILVLGHDAEDLGGIPHGCDLDSPRGTFLIGVSTDDDLTWLSEGSEVLWDSTVSLGLITPSC